MDAISSEFSPERKALIDRLGKALNMSTVNNTNHAFLWLCDFQALQDIVRSAESGTPQANFNLKRGFQNYIDATTALKAWLARPMGKGESPSPPTPAESSAPSSPIKSPKRKAEWPNSPSKIPRLIANDQRSRPAKKIASERDDGVCVITKMGEPVEVCHIYAFSLGRRSKTARDEFWDLLRSFWPADTISKWEQAIFGPEGTEVPQNLLCLSSLVHQLWGKARLAFEPVEKSDDGKALTIRFWWLPANKFQLYVPLCCPPSLPSSLKASPLNAKLWDCETDKPIYSGQLITLKTSDPVSMPLPSFELLDLQWKLNRVAALCGAADITDEELDDIDPFMEAMLYDEASKLPAQPPYEEPERPRRQPTFDENCPPPRPQKESSKVREFASAEEAIDDPSFLLCD